MTGHQYRTSRTRFAAQEMLSPAEERFERWRHTLGLFLGPLAAAALYAAPMPSLAPPAHRLAAVLGWVVTWWVTEPIPIPITALIGALLCVVSGIAPAKAVFAIIFLFSGSFILAEAMAVHGLDRRFAFRILTLKWVGNTCHDVSHRAGDNLCHGRYDGETEGRDRREGRKAGKVKIPFFQWIVAYHLIRMFFILVL